jgi:dienelactone hydrolase
VRSFELYLAGGCVFAIVWPALFGVRPRRGVVALGMPLLVIVQWQIEGFRWQLLPLYIVALGLAVGDVVAVDERHLPWFRRVGRGIFGLVGLGLVVAPAVILPVPQLPLPAGPSTIGTATAEVTGVVPEGGFGGDRTGHRTIVVHAWYPAVSVENQQPEVWEPNFDVVVPAFARRVGRPGFFFDQARFTRSHAYEDAPVADGAFPLLIYSHGWGEFSTIALDQIESLVSQGYIVISIDHPGGAVATVVDGQVIPLATDALDPPDANAAEKKAAEAAVIDTFASDVRAVLDEVDRGPHGALGDLVTAIDHEAIGMWGHGIGGGAVLEVCLTDPRCKAVAGLDPIVDSFPDALLATTATQPMLMMRSDLWRGNENDAVLRGLVARSQTVTYWVDVLGADTSDFVSAPVISPFADRLGLKGPIDGQRVMMINHRFLSGFFDRFLLGTGSAALDTATFPEVNVEVVDNRLVGG